MNLEFGNDEEQFLSLLFLLLFMDKFLSKQKFIKDLQNNQQISCGRFERSDFEDCGKDGPNSVQRLLAQNPRCHCYR